MGDFVTAVRSLTNERMIAFLIQGGVVMIPLLLSSVIALAVVLERLSFWRRLKKQEIDHIILQLVTAGNLDHALKFAGESGHPVARVLYAGLEYKDIAPATAMEATAQTEIQQLRSYLPVLDTIITLAPLLGLLGTITGMIGAFGIVSDAGLGQPQAITGGVAEALIATATGLFIAIMTLIPYNYFRAKVERVTERIEEQATRLELLLHKREN